MGFLDKAKAAAESAAEKAKDVAESATAKAKDGVDEVQTKRALGNAYESLGKTTYELAQAGEISHPKLAEAVDEIKKLEEHLAEGDDAPASGNGFHADAAASAEPEAAAPATPAEPASEAAESTPTA
jgi:hypothetical protein